MPIIMNVIEACKYKEKYPDRKVYYKEAYTEDHEELSFVEELISFRDELRFELTEGSYPRGWDQDNSQWSHFYNRHIFGEIYCETEEDEITRLETEKNKKEKLLQKEKEELDKQIENLQKKRSKLK